MRSFLFFAIPIQMHLLDLFTFFCPFFFFFYDFYSLFVKRISANYVRSVGRVDGIKTGYRTERYTVIAVNTGKCDKPITGCIVTKRFIPRRK